MLRKIVVGAVLGILILLTACGAGSGTGRSAAPAFSSIAPQVASEGARYTYTIAVTSPDGKPVTYTLTTAPAGATLNGDTVAWTPTSAQSPIANQFAVTVTAASGLSSSQSWTVTPNGTIFVSEINTNWTAQGPVNASHNLIASSDQVVRAFLPQSDGSLQVWPGNSNADGSVSIPNVPAGYFWLQIGDSFENYLFWTKQSNFDFGWDLIGRQPLGHGTSTFNVSLDGLDPCRSLGWVSLVCPNVGWSNDLAIEGDCIPTSSSNPCPPALAYGATTVNAVESLSGPAIDPSEGDACYVLQTESYGPISPGMGATVLGTALSTPSLATSNGSTASIAGTMSDSSPQSLDISINGSAWEQLAQEQTNPLNWVNNPSTSVSAQLILQPFVADRVAALPSFGGFTTLAQPIFLITRHHCLWHRLRHTTSRMSILERCATTIPSPTPGYPYWPPLKTYVFSHQVKPSPLTDLPCAPAVAL